MPYNELNQLNSNGETMSKIRSVLIATMLMTTVISGSALGAESEFTCKHNQKTDYWIQNKNPIIFSNGVRLAIKKDFSSSAPSNPMYATPVEGNMLYMYGSKVGTFGGLTHYQVCSKFINQ